MTKITLNKESLIGFLKSFIEIHDDLGWTIDDRDSYEEYLEMKHLDEYDLLENDCYDIFRNIYDAHRYGPGQEIFDALNIYSVHDLIALYFGKLS